MISLPIATLEIQLLSNQLNCSEKKTEANEEIGMARKINESAQQQDSKIISKIIWKSVK